MTFAGTNVKVCGERVSPARYCADCDADCSEACPCHAPTTDAEGVLRCPPCYRLRQEYLATLPECGSCETRGDLTECKDGIDRCEHCAEAWREAGRPMPCGCNDDEECRDCRTGRLFDHRRDLQKEGRA